MKKIEGAPKDMKSVREERFRYYRGGHKWVRDECDKLGLMKTDNFREFLHRFSKFVEGCQRIRQSEVAFSEETTPDGSTPPLKQPSRAIAKKPILHWKLARERYILFKRLGFIHAITPLRSRARAAIVCAVEFALCRLLRVPAYAYCRIGCSGRRFLRFSYVLPCTRLSR